MARSHHALNRRSFGLALLTAAAAPRAWATESFRIAAAADLQVVLPELLTTFDRTRGATAKVTYGSTGNFARQLRQGAPFDIFLAADERFVLDLVRDKVLPAAGPVYARGRLALIGRRSQPFESTVLAADPVGEIASLILAGRDIRVSLANPEHAPYGERAIEVLRTRGLLDLYRPRFVYGENVAQATQYVATGAAAVGFVSLSLARAPLMAETLASAVLPATLHSALNQRLAVSAKASPMAIAFAEFLVTTEAQRIFSAHHFDPPDSSG